MTTAVRRLAKVEAALTPTALVLRRLAKAQAYDDLTAYPRALIAAQPRLPPGSPGP